jgi:hypothetical protein
MHPSNGIVGGIAATGDASEVCDLAIDTQYASKNSSPTDYAHTPWKTYKDATNSYLSVRFDQRKKFLQEVGEAERHRINHELDRISKTRKAFSKNPKKKQLIENLGSSLQIWKQDVLESIPSFVADLKTKEESQSAEVPNHQWNLRILSRVAE